MRENEKKTIMKVGIFTVTVFCLIVFATMLLSREHSLISRKMYVFSKFKNAQNLKTGAAVKLKGIKIGNVESIDITSMEDVSIKMKIIAEYARWIKKDSKVSVKTQGMLGDKFVEIEGGTENAPSVEEEAIIEATEGKDIKKIIDTGEDILEVSKKTINSLNQLINDINGNHQLEQWINNVNSSTKKMEAVFNQLNTKLSTLNIENINQTTEKMSKIFDRIEKGPGSLHSLIYSSEVHEDLQHLLGGAQRNKVLKYFIRESIEKSKQ